MRRKMTAIRPDSRWAHVVAPVGTVLMSIKRRERCVVRARHGYWIHSYAGRALAQPQIGGLSPAVLDRYTADAFLWAYRPGPGDVVFDVGAGVGGEVPFFSQLVGASGRVVGIEAHPHTFGCLGHTVELNDLRNVTIVQRAVTERSGPVFLEDDSEEHISNRLVDQAAGGVAVSGQSLPEIAAGLGVTEIDLLKMNIEGAELAALRGAADFLPRVRHMVVSCHDFLADRGGPEVLRTFAEVCSLLDRAGFSVRTRPDHPLPWVRYYVYAERQS